MPAGAGAGTGTAGAGAGAGPGGGIDFGCAVQYDLAGLRHHRTPAHREPECGDYVALPFPGAGWFVGAVGKVDSKTLAAVASGRRVAQPWPYQLKWEDGGAPTWHPLASASYGREWALLDAYDPLSSA